MDERPKPIIHLDVEDTTRTVGIYGRPCHLTCTACARSIYLGIRGAFDRESAAQGAPQLSHCTSCIRWSGVGKGADGGMVVLVPAAQASISPSSCADSWVQRWHRPQNVAKKSLPKRAYVSAGSQLASLDGPVSMAASTGTSTAALPFDDEHAVIVIDESTMDIAIAARRTGSFTAHQYHGRAGLGLPPLIPHRRGWTTSKRPPAESAA